MRGWMWFGVIVTLGACSEDQMAAREGAEVCDPLSVRALRVTPAEVERGEEVVLRFEAELDPPVYRPVSLELLGGEAYNVRVVVPLEEDEHPGASPVLYRATLTNPFGAGLPPSYFRVQVLRESGFGCDEETPLTASFTLK